MTGDLLYQFFRRFNVLDAPIIEKYFQDLKSILGKFLQKIIEFYFREFFES